VTIRLLVVSQHWEPAQRAGGARSTERAVAAVADLVDAWVVTGDRDVGDATPWPDLPPADAGSPAVEGRRTWVERGGVHVRYQTWDRRSGRRVRQAIDEIDPDLIYLPSIFAPGSRAVLWRRAIGGVRCPVVVAPEGELHPGALAHHPGRKRGLLALMRLAGLGRRVRWRAAGTIEASQIRDFAGPGAPVDIAPDLHGRALKAATTAPDKEPGRARVAFVGTIVPKKGLTRALEIMWPARHEVSFSIYGPAPDPAEWARCQSILDRCEPEVDWRTCGPIPHAQIGTAFADADLCILPTLGENYGYVIAEALEAGCPVLTSDQTPWRGLAADGCGWDLPLDPVEAWRDRLRVVIGWDAEDRQAARVAARSRASRERQDEEATIEAWRALVERAARPDTPKG